jgi:hypothetical protein
VPEDLLVEAFAGLMQVIQGASEIPGVPQNDRRRDQVPRCGTMNLAFVTAIPEAAQAVERHRSGEGVASLSLVQLFGGFPAQAPIQSSVPSVRSIRPISRNACASLFCFG